MKKITLLAFSICLISAQLQAQCGGFDMSISANNPTCYGFSDGFFTVTPISGNGGYTFTLTNSSGTQINFGNSPSANGLMEGWYYATIVDAMGCVTEDSVFINAPDQMQLDLTISSTLCFDDSSGSAVIDTVFNYTGSYSGIAYYWSPNPTGVNGVGQNELLNVPAGDYIVVVNDANGCSRVFDFTITEPDALVFSQLGSEPYSTAMNGVIYADGAGGTPDYTYLWTNLSTFATSTNTTWGGLSPGDYEIVITDANGCTITAIVTVGYLSLSQNPSSNLEVYPTLVQNNQLQVNNAFQGTIVLEIYNLTGEKVAEHIVQSGQHTLAISLPAATYLFRAIAFESSENILQEGKIIVTN